MPHSQPKPQNIFAVLDMIAACRTPPEVVAVLLAELHEFGLRTYVIGGMPTPNDPRPSNFMYHNWPDAWSQMYVERNFAAFDPVVRAAKVRAMPLTVGEVRAGHAGFVPGPEADVFFATGEAMTGGKGLIVPIFGPHGYRGIVVFIGQREDFSTEERARLHLLGIHAHDRMLALFGRDAADGLSLSAREVEVLRAARAGTGDEAIALALGISVRTVRFHFENARKKLSVRTRSEALVKAVSLHMLGS